MGPPQPQYVVLVSFDGFRYDYLDKYDATNLKGMRANGATVNQLVPTFPSKTFPNHYSLVTGCYAGNHGLVDNNFNSPKGPYRMRNPEAVRSADYYEGVPLWQLVQQHGMKSASYFWVGSEAPIAGSFPDYYTQYDGSVPNEERIDQVINWLSLPPSERPQLVTLYFSLVDDAGHAYGPESEEVAASVSEADRLVGVLKSRLSTLDLSINLIVTADHGMLEVDAANIVSIEMLLARGDIEVVNSGTHAHIYTENELTLSEFSDLIVAPDSCYSILQRSDFPAIWHYEHENVGDFLLMAKPGFTINNTSRLTPADKKGVHGYDPYVVPEMGALFVAEGPLIKSGESLAMADNVHIYPFVAALLGIDSLPRIDGDPQVLAGFLVKSKPVH